MGRRLVEGSISDKEEEALAEARRASVVARVALIVAAIAFALSLLGMFLPI